MKEVDFVTAVRNAAYSESGDITCEVQFEGAVNATGEPIWSPFTAMASDVTDYGRQLYYALVNGEYGEVSPFHVTPEMLEAAREAKKREITDWRKEQELLPFTFEWNGRTWNAGKDSFDRIAPVAMAAKVAGARTMLDWGDASNVAVSLTMTELQDLAAAMAHAVVERNNAIYQRLREMKEQLALLSTLDEVRAFTPSI